MKYLRTSSTPHLAQHLYGLRHHAQRLPRPREFPARDGDESVRLQVVEVLAESLYGVKVVFAEGKAPAAVEAQVSTSVIWMTSYLSRLLRIHERPSLT